MRDRIVPWRRLVAFAQISATRSSVSASTVSTLASRSVPMPTTARPTEATPSCRSTSTSVASAATTCVSRSAYDWTSRSSESTASTGCPSRTRESATAPPKRASPMATTASDLLDSANDGPRFRVAVQTGAGVEGERGGHGDRADPAAEHQGDQDELGRPAQVVGHAHRETDGAERRHGLEQGPVEAEPGARGEQREAAGGAQRQPTQRHADRLPLGAFRDPAVPDDDVRLAVDL